MKRLIVLLWQLVFVAAALMAQQSTQQTVENNFPLVQHLLLVFGVGSPQLQESLCAHVRLSSSQCETVLSIVTNFRANEGTLRQQADALIAKGNQASPVMTQIRTQRRQLVIQTAVEILTRLNNEGSNYLSDYLQQGSALAASGLLNMQNVQPTTH